MPQAHDAKTSVGTIIKVRTATGNDAVKATLSTGSGNSAIVFTAVKAGAAGNNIRVAIVDPGASGSLSIGVVGNDITITAAHNGSVITSTVNDIIIAIAQDAAADALVVASDGAGDGSGAIAALTQTALTSGADATHTFVEILGVGDLTLPPTQTELLNITSHSSPENASGRVAAEYVQARIEDFPEFQIPLTWWNTSNAGHARLKALEGGSAELFQFYFRESADEDFQASYLVRAVERGAPVNGVYTANITVKLTGAITLI